MDKMQRKEGATSKTKGDTLKPPHSDYNNSANKKPSSFLESSKADKGKQGVATESKLTKVISKSSSSGQFKERPTSSKNKFTNEPAGKESHHLPCKGVKEEVKHPSHSSAFDNTERHTKTSYFKSIEQQVKKTEKDPFNEAKSMINAGDSSLMKGVSAPYDGSKTSTTFKVRAVPTAGPYYAPSTSTTDYKTRDQIPNKAEEQKRISEFKRSYSSYYGEEGERESCKLEFNQFSCVKIS